PAPRAVVATALRERYNLAAGDADLMAAWSGGRGGWGLGMGGAPAELETRPGQIAALGALPGGPRRAGVRWGGEGGQEFRTGEQAAVYEALELWQSWWRDALLIAGGCPAAIVHIDRRDELERAAGRYSLADIHEVLARLETAARQLRENVNPQLALE